MNLDKLRGELKKGINSFINWNSSLTPKEEALLVYDDAVDDISDADVFGHFFCETILPKSITSNMVDCPECGNTIYCLKKASIAIVYIIGKCNQCGHEHKSFY